MAGIETDCEALVFHGHDGKVVSMADMASTDEAALMEVIMGLYPDMPLQIAQDLVPLMAGNIEHARAVAGREKSPVELQHMERVLAIGQGFDWLHKINYALIVNDADPRLEVTIGMAAGIIKANRDAGRIPRESAVYFASVSYYDEHEKNGAIMNAKYLSRLGMEAIKKAHPDLDGFFKPLTAVMHWDTRQLEVISEDTWKPASTDAAAAKNEGLELAPA
jgi:hypothetical protein